VLRSDPVSLSGPRASNPSSASPLADDGGGAVFDLEDLQALREEYEDRIRRLEHEKDAALDVVRKDAGQRMAALRAEQEARLAAESEMRQQLIEELTIELASAREEGERTARDADRRRLVSEDKLRWALGEIDRMSGELARVREVLQAHLAPPPPTVEPLDVPAEALVTSSVSVVSAALTSAAFAARKKRIRLR
jgi:hypothetical protein